MHLPEFTTMAIPNDDIPKAICRAPHLEKLSDLPSPSSENDTQNGFNTPSTPKLNRTMSLGGAIGLAFAIANSWMSYAAIHGTALVYGGGVTTLFALLIAAAAQWIILLGLSELVSAIPSSGGSYHFVYFLAPKRTRNFASFVIGITNLLGFWIGGVSGMIYTTISTFGMVSFWIEGFQPTPWEVYLAYVAIILLSLIPIFLTPALKTKRLTETCLFMSILCFILFVTILAVMGREKYRPENLVLHRNLSGWSNSTGWLLSISLGMYNFSAAGTVVHLSEEVPRPQRDIPMAINTTMVLSVATAVPFIIVLLLGIKDMDAVQTAWIASLEAFYQGTGSKAVATFLQACLTGLYFTTVSTQWVSVSRIAWTLARDNVFPYSTYLTQISPTFHFPVRTTILSAVFCIVFGLIYIASSTAFNSVINLATLLVNIGFTVPQGILACRRRHKLPAKRWFKLGSVVGYTVNVFSVLWLILVGVLFCFPTKIPTTKGSMN
ncbi:amino acid/polyamine transporter I [Aspergillus karnatakaensis]|uniref:amino acid/polyamine transporter I n=1 Tax=Aspergillus karnatakaensis TaxID=1810916 RepID=UPI003CCD1313